MLRVLIRRPRQGISYEYPHHKFLWRNKKNICGYYHLSDFIANINYQKRL